MKKILFICTALTALTSVKAQSDNPCGAPALAVNSTCVYTVGSITGATNTTGVPAPGCASYSGPDVWYTATVPASGAITFTMDVSSGGPTDMGMAVYTGSSCSSLTLTSCDDDGGPGLMPMINASGLTAGSTVYIRIWKYGGGGTGPFQICAQAGTSTGCTSGGGNTTCATADPFCSTTAYNYCNTTGTPSLGGGGIYGCLGSSPNPAFYYLHVGSTGPITISINQYSTSGSPIDVDFVCWGPFSTQPAMCPGLSASNIVSCSYSASASETCSIPSAVAGQWYMLLITNFSGVAGYVQFSQTGGSGSTDCSIVTPCSITGTPTNIACFGGTGSISATCTGTAPYTVNLVNSSGTTVGTSSGAGPTFNFTGLAAGTYTLNLTTSGTPVCTNTTTVTVSGPSAPLTVSSSHTDVLCSGGCSGTLSSSASGGTSPYSYSWSGGLGLGANKAGVCAGTYTVTVTDVNGCTATSTQTIADPSFTLSTSSTDEICGASDGTVSATATPVSGTVTLNWYSDAAHTILIGTGNSITGLPGGTYYLNASSTTGCVTDVPVTVNSPALPSVSITLNSQVTGFGLCNGDATAVYTGVAPITVAWSNGVTTDNDNTLCPGLQCVTITDVNGCTDSACVTITEPPLLTVSVTKTDPLCFSSCDGTITSNTNGGVPPYTYSWSSGDTTANLASLCAGSYSLTVTDANGNTANASITLINPSPLVMGAPAVTNVSCNGVCDGTITASASGGSGTLTYTASPVLAGSGPAYTNVCAGTYLVTVTDSNACALSQSVTVTQPSALAISMSSVNASCIFPNGSATANVSGGTPPYTYLWSNGATNAVNSNITSGTYSVDVTDANGCTISGSVVVGNNPPLVINAAANPTICNGESTIVSATASGGSGGPYTFTWVDENGNPVSSTTSGSGTSATVSPTDTTAYIVTVDDGCVASVSDDTVTVNVNPLPQVAFSVSVASGCSPFTTTVLVNTNIGTAFDYDFNCDGAIDLSSSSPSASNTYNVAGTYDVCVTATSPYGCSTRSSMPALVTAFPLPVAEFVATPVTASILTPTINFTELSNGAAMYSWNFGDSISATGLPGNDAIALYTSGSIEQPEHVYQDTGHYDVSLLVQNIYGCKDSITHPVIIEPDFEVFVPNAFTPNADGRNDIFMPMGIGQSADRYEFYVFDRWGQVIFKTTTPNTGWDGTHNSVKCPSDTYVWKINVVDFKKIKHSYTGHVTLLR